MERFHIQAADEPDHLAVQIAGDVDLASAGELAEGLARALAADRPIVVDCSRVTFLDSAGLQALAEARWLARKCHTGFRLFPLSDPVRRVLELSGTADLFTPNSEPADPKGSVQV